MISFGLYCIKLLKSVSSPYCSKVAGTTAEYNLKY